MDASIAGARSRSQLNVDQAVRDRYSQAAQGHQAELCCPVEYDERYLEIIPDEILQRDYGCGDPSRHLEAGDTVLDLGCGGGKICYIAAQVVGPHGRVIGVDCNDSMLELARRHRDSVAGRLGYSNVEFRKGRIQDLGLDLELFEQYLAEHPITDSSDWLRADEHARELRHSATMIPDESVDAVVSNCVLNLVRAEDRRELFSEIFRVLRRGGRAVISDIASDESVPAHLQDDAKLWSGCMSGAYREDRFLEAFEDAGFHGIEILTREQEPWAVVEGAEFRSMTIRAWKGKDGPCLDRRQAVIYHGPWKAVIDDDGHKLLRGRRMAVCDKTFQIYSRAPYDAHITPVSPHHDVPPDVAEDFACDDTPIRSPQETKSGGAVLTVLPDGCGPSGCC